MEDPEGHHWGYDLTKRAGVRSGVLYPTLRRMEVEGWVDDGWEDPEAVSGRPPRRYYQLTGEGRAALGGMIEQARLEGRVSPLHGRPVLDA